MGYVKVKKAAGAFDIVSAEQVARIALNGTGTSAEIDVAFISATANNDILTLRSTNHGSAGGGFVQADVQALNEAIGLIGGGAGMIDVSLSNTLASTSIA
tara:strand:- start:53 stop:352 length:300 start_codon:yes stop_codon:yes gene_type:complete